MQQAIALARQAEINGDVPVGALVVENDVCIGRGFNQPLFQADPTAHAEIVAIRDAAKYKNNYRLPNTTLYVTIEPCTMCFGAMIHARLDKLVYGAAEPRAGCVHSQLNLQKCEFYNHRIECESGVLAEECGQLMLNFFQRRR